MKPYYRKKGQYKDGRNKICVEWESGSKNLPKPEIILQILEQLGDRSNFPKTTKKINPKEDR